MRVAVCISGQMRGFEQAAPSLVERVIRPLGADVFVHTWSDIGLSNNIHNRLLPHPMRPHLKRYANLPDFREHFPSSYARLVRDQGVVTRAALERAYGPCTAVIEDYPDDEAAFFGTYPPSSLLELQPKAKWSLPLFYKIFACNELKRRAETAAGAPYDLVVRVRPDLTIGSDFLSKNPLVPSTLFHRIRTNDPNFQIGDQLFFGDSDTVDQVAGLFPRMNDIYASIDQPIEPESVKKYWAEGLLFNYVNNCTTIATKAFRTEAFSVRSEFQLVDVPGAIPEFWEFFEGMRSDLAALPPAAAEDVARGCSRALFHHAQPLKSEDEWERAADLADIAERDGLFDTSLTRGVLAYKRQDFPEAEQRFAAALSAEPGTSLPSLWLGRSLLMQDRVDEALPLLDAAVTAPFEYDSQNPNQKRGAYFWRGRGHEAAGHWAQASDDYAVARNLGMTSADVLAHHGRVLHELGKWYAATPLLAKTLASRPKDQQTRHRLARCYAEIGLPKPIVSDLWTDSPQVLARRDPDALVHLAGASIALERLEEARRCIEAFAGAERISEAGAVSVSTLTLGMGWDAAPGIRAALADRHPGNRELQQLAGRAVAVERPADPPRTAPLGSRLRFSRATPGTGRNA